MWTINFWKAAAERAIKTFAQTFGAFLLVGAGIGDVNWLAALSVAGVATLASLVTSIASAAATDGSPSLTHVEVLSADEAGDGNSDLG